MGLLIRTTPTLEAYIDSWRLRGGQVMVVANPGGWPAVKLPLTRANLWLSLDRSVRHTSCPPSVYYSVPAQYSVVDRYLILTQPWSPCPRYAERPSLSRRSRSPPPADWRRRNVGTASATLLRHCDGVGPPAARALNIHADYGASRFADGVQTRDQ